MSTSHLSIAEIARQFGSYVLVRKNNNRVENQEQQDAWNVFLQLMNRYSKNDYKDVPVTTVLPEVIGKYMKYIPMYERKDNLYMSMFCMITQYNEYVTNGGKATNNKK
jgi:hypothetical protein